MLKPKYIYLIAAIVLIALPAGSFFYLEMMNIDCDQFSCIGYLVVLLPMFLFGGALFLAVLLSIIANEVYRIIVKIKNRSNEID